VAFSTLYVLPLSFWCVSLRFHFSSIFQDLIKCSNLYLLHRGASSRRGEQQHAREKVAAVVSQFTLLHLWATKIVVPSASSIGARISFDYFGLYSTILAFFCCYICIIYIYLSYFVVLCAGDGQIISRSLVI
jgi:hypothetical protein